MRDDGVAAAGLLIVEPVVVGEEGEAGDELRGVGRCDADDAVAFPWFIELDHNLETFARGYFQDLNITKWCRLSWGDDRMTALTSTF